MSAKEWIASASIEAAPVTMKPITLAIAIPRLAMKAATIARLLPLALMSRLPEPGY